MRKEVFEKIIKVYGVLTCQWETHYYRDGYTCYDRVRWEENQNLLDFLNQFENVPFKNYFRDSRIKKFDDPKKYFTSDTIKINENLVCFHYHFSSILYYYCFYQLSDEIKNFRKMIDIDIEKKFYKLTKKDENEFKYAIRDHKNINEYFLESLTNYGLIWRLLTIGSIISIDNNSVIIKYSVIDKVLKDLEEIYDFRRITIL